MDKNTPHYDLAVIKADVRRLGWRAFTHSARRTGSDMELTLADMQEVVFMLQRNMLYKSMTTYDNQRIWQDVYHINSHGLEIYINVSYHYDRRPPVISFKENNS